MKKFYTNHGNPIQPVFDLQINVKNGQPDVVQVGTRNIQEEIDSYARSCDLNVIIQRVRNGELDLLQRRSGMYGDFTNAPSTLGELLQFRIDGKNLYDSLPPDVRANFANFDEFLSTAGSVDWLKKFGVKFDDPDMVKPEDKEGDVSE